MVIYVKNPRLKARIFRSIKRFDRLALKAYSRGKMRQGRKYETCSDRLYAKNYRKIFGRK